MRKSKKIWLFLVGVFVIIPSAVGVYHYNKPLPQYISYESAVYETNDVAFLYDVTYERDGKRIVEQQLMHEALEMIAEAEQFLVVDMFLYNDDYDRAKGDYPNSAEQFTQALLDKRAANPALPITVMTDPVNELYGANTSPFFEQLRAEDIDVITTNLKPLRDSNALYSSIWRTYLQWWPVSADGFLPNAFNPDGGKGSFGAYFDLLNFKANHRKIVLNESRALITSANLTHDGSSYHSNIGFVVGGTILSDIYKTEQAVAAMSGITLADHTFEKAEDGELAVKFVTEGEIQNEMLEAIEAAEQVQIGVFYIADRKIVTALKDAAARGVKVQLLFDPNKDAFGLEKNGIPNRQVAAELMQEPNVEVRFYATNGEQFHSKFLYTEAGDTATLIGGSANFTRRNIQDYNLESNLAITMQKDAPLAKEFQAYYARLWHNEGGDYSVDFTQYEDQSIWKKFVYRIQEWTGMSTF